MFQTQHLYSPQIRACHPGYTIPDPHESTWTSCQLAEIDAIEGDRFLVRRDYDEDEGTWIVRDYLVTKATDHVFYGWTRQLVAYYINEYPPYPYTAIRMCQPVRFSQHVPEWGVEYTSQAWIETVGRALVASGAFADE